ncbi:GerMN domain-containing protein [Ruminococcus sp. CLA-AA-H200]|uniref:GerMN domain-containing protein n=1 Tax=Ruminococcus turbiniformis TaxID=2881258 RepID=A0ABS8FTE4_9FIRM|nr:GerMN domain-containing protein [Ruminococcus turbiniformis]MCC2253311.1 GerMN domain-containing protein [Ruminococcus turbiniformis]
MRIGRQICALCLCLAVLLSGCGRTGGDGDSFIYCLNADRTGLVKTEWDIPEGDVLTAAEAVLDQLGTVPEDIDCTAPLPENVSVQSCELSGTILEVDFSGTYLDIGSLEEKLIRAAVVQSLMQIEGVNAVSFTVDGSPLTDSEGATVGLMNGDDFVENTGSSPSSYQTDTLTLYFADESGEKLVEETQDVRYSSNVSKDKLIVEKLMQGPKGSDAYPTINPAANLLSVTTKDGICYVNFDSTFLTGAYDILPELTIYSIVNSLIEGTEAHLVQITINGESNETYMETVDLTQPLKENRDLLAAENGEE